MTDLNYADSDIGAKTSGFGIGELGHVPASTPLDELQAAELNRQTRPQPATKPYKLEFFGANAPALANHTFATLNEMLDFARSAAETVRADAVLFGPGYSIGALYHIPGGYVRLKWRVPVKLDAPDTYCEECEGDAIDSHGRCTACGVTDMVVTRWYTWDVHEETI